MAHRDDAVLIDDLDFVLSRGDAPVQRNDSDEELNLGNRLSGSPTRAYRPVRRENSGGYLRQFARPPALLVQLRNEGGPEPLLTWDGPNIRKYNARKLFRYHFIALRGTVFDLRQWFTWLQLLFLCFIAFLVAVYMQNYTEKLQPGETDHWWDHLNSASQTVNNMVIFLLGFYNAVVISRWWDLRTAVGRLQTHIQNVVSVCAAYNSHEDGRALRDQIVRYCTVAHKLVYLSYETSNMQTLVDEGILYEDERLALQATPNRILVLCHWMSMLSVRSVSDGFLAMPESSLPIIQTNIIGIREQSSLIDLSTSTQLPFPYVHLLTVIVKVALVTLAASIGQQAGSSYRNGHSAWIAFEVFRLIIMNFFYQGLLELQVILAAPFLNHPAHFPRGLYVRRIAKASQDLVKDPEKVPFEIPCTSGPNAATLRKRI
eukprot:m.297100 g.297100  ORF g.297100 m.297100 type:complete len:430 (-) comp13537_c0_seq1:1348-2637(-)